MNDIGLSGYIGSGKTTISNMFVEKYGYRKMGLADVLKEELANELGIDVKDLYTEGVKEQFRTQMQDLGHSKREQDCHYWVNKFIDKYYSLSMNRSIIVDDLRYPNELIALARNSFVTVRLNTPYGDIVEYLRDKGKSSDEIIHTMNHSSETALGGDEFLGFFDVVIDAPRSRPINDIFEEIEFKFEKAALMV